MYICMYMSYVFILTYQFYHHYKSPMIGPRIKASTLTMMYVYNTSYVYIMHSYLIWVLTNFIITNQFHHYYKSPMNGPRIKASTLTMTATEEPLTKVIYICIFGYKYVYKCACTCTPIYIFNPPILRITDWGDIYMNKYT
jgi:hypothetical protein